MNKTLSNEQRERESEVRRAYIPPDLTYETMSELGRELYDLSMEMERSGETLLSEEDLELELLRRRGGYIPDGK